MLKSIHGKQEIKPEATFNIKSDFIIKVMMNKVNRIKFRHPCHLLQYLDLHKINSSHRYCFSDMIYDRFNEKREGDV